MNEATKLLEIMKDTVSNSNEVDMLYGTAVSEATNSSCMVTLDGLNVAQSVKTLIKPNVGDRVALLLADKRLTVIGVLGGNAADSIVERHSSSDAGYVKYADGRMEAWGYLTYSNVAITESWGSLYCSQAIQPKMIDGFHIVQSCIVGLSSYGYGITLYTGGSLASRNSMGSFFIVRPTSVTVPSLQIHYTIRGRWRT